MSARTIFVTGTDTGVGKTCIAAAMLRGLRQAGHTAVGYKPVASGCQITPEGLRNDDALALQAASTPGWGYDVINPYAFEPPIAPHIAAADAGVTVARSVLDAGYEHLAAASDWVVIEGAGGWRVPLSATLDFADWASAWQWPVVLVVGMRLGCVNHALLSAATIAARTRLTGWIANSLPPIQPRLEDNISCLQQRLSWPLLERVGIDPAPDLALPVQAW